MAIQDLNPSTSQIQSRRHRGEGRIFPRKGTSFLWCAYFLRGKEFRESTRETDEKKALKFLKNRMDEVGADKIGARAFIGPQQQRVTVNDILDDLETEYKLGGKKRIPREVNPQMKSHLRRIREYFGTMRAMNVHQQHIQAFISLLHGQRKQDATINRALQLLRQSYRIAVNSDPPKLSRIPKIQTLDESGNVRTGKFTKDEAEAIFAILPKYMSDVAQFAYETGARAGEILKLRWSYLKGDAICVPRTDTKNRKPRQIAITPEIEEIIRRRQLERKSECNLIFHNDGRSIRDYRKCWQTACVINGLGVFCCRDCRDETGQYAWVLNAKRICPRCTQHCSEPKYRGRIFHDFRRSAAHEMWVAGSTIEDCMEVTGHATTAMFKRYADLFSEREKRERQLEVQQRRHEWLEAQQLQQSENLVRTQTALRQ